MFEDDTELYLDDAAFLKAVLALDSQQTKQQAVGGKRKTFSLSQAGESLEKKTKIETDTNVEKIKNVARSGETNVENINIVASSGETHKSNKENNINNERGDHVLSFGYQEQCARKLSATAPNESQRNIMTPFAIPNKGEASQLGKAPAKHSSNNKPPVSEGKSQPLAFPSSSLNRDNTANATMVEDHDVSDDLLANFFNDVDKHVFKGQSLGDRENMGNIIDEYNCDSDSAKTFISSNTNSEPAKFALNSSSKSPRGSFTFKRTGHSPKGTFGNDSPIFQPISTWNNVRETDTRTAQQQVSTFVIPKESTQMRNKQISSYHKSDVTSKSIDAHQNSASFREKHSQSANVEPLLHAGEIDSSFLSISLSPISEKATPEVFPKQIDNCTGVDEKNLDCSTTNTSVLTSASCFIGSKNKSTDGIGSNNKLPVNNNSDSFKTPNVVNLRTSVTTANSRLNIVGHKSTLSSTENRVITDRRIPIMHSTPLQKDTPLVAPSNVGNHEVRGQNRSIVSSDNLETPSTVLIASTGESEVKVRRKRKFPGPAGVLPKLKNGQSLADMANVKPVETTRVSQRPGPEMGGIPAGDITCSQASTTAGTEQRFHEPPWSTMTRQLEPGACVIHKNFNIAAVLRKASKKQLPRGGKVPVICVLIDQLNTHTADASVTLRDPSGVMKGTIHRQLVKEYQTELQVGCVLVLRQCSVFSPSPRSHYLNITPNNVVRIYPRDGSGDNVTASSTAILTEDRTAVLHDRNTPEESSDRIKSTGVIKVNDFASEDFVVSREPPPQSFTSSVNQMTSPNLGQRTHLSSSSPSLFNSPGQVGMQIRHWNNSSSLERGVTTPGSNYQKRSPDAPHSSRININQPPDDENTPKVRRFNIGHRQAVSSNGQQVINRSLNNANSMPENINSTRQYHWPNLQSSPPLKTQSVLNCTPNRIGSMQCRSRTFSIKPSTTTTAMTPLKSTDVATNNSKPSCNTPTGRVFTNPRVEQTAVQNGSKCDNKSSTVGSKNTALGKENSSIMSTTVENVTKSVILEKNAGSALDFSVQDDVDDLLREFEDEAFA